jgi:transcription elongation factor Elf1
MSEPPTEGRRQAPAETRAVQCPFCGSTETSVISAFGSQLLTEQRSCLACKSYFEAIKA